MAVGSPDIGPHPARHDDHPRDRRDSGKTFGGARRRTPRTAEPLRSTAISLSATRYCQEEMPPRTSLRLDSYRRQRMTGPTLRGLNQRRRPDIRRIERSPCFRTLAWTRRGAPGGVVAAAASKWGDLSGLERAPCLAAEPGAVRGSACGRFAGRARGRSGWTAGGRTVLCLADRSMDPNRSDSALSQACSAIEEGW